MKKFLITYLSIFCLSWIQAQEKEVIQTAPSKITHLIFPASIEEVYIENSEDFIFYKQDNVLKLSTLVETPIQTNLKVNLRENQGFSFVVENTQNASKLTYVIENLQKKPKKTSDFWKTCQKVLKQYSPPIKKKTKGLLNYLFSKKLEVQNANLKLTFLDLLIYENKMYFHIEIQNKSLIDFKIQEMAFETKSKVGKKKASLTLRKLPILATCKDLQKVPALTTSQEVLVLDSFSLEKQEVLLLEILESPQGKRHLKLQLPPFALTKAKPLN